MLLFFVVSGFCFALGQPSTELKQMSEIIKRLEEKIENQEVKIKNQDAVINELKELGTQNLELLGRMETRSERTEEELKTIRATALFSAPGDKAVRDLPYIMMCAYKYSSRDTGIIPYDELTLDYNNCDRPGGGCAAMDIDSGTFTAQTGGLYTITFSGQADLNPGSHIGLCLLHNGAQLKESDSYSYNNGDGNGKIEEMLSRTVVSIYVT